MTTVVILLIGLVAGIVTGLIGASGVMVIVPGLTLLGFAPIDAIGVSLFADTLASLTVAWTYSQAGRLNLRQGWWIALGSVAGAQLGSLVSVRVPDTGLGGSFGIFLIVSGIVFWIRSTRGVKPSNGADDAPARKQGAFVRLLRKNVVISGLVLGLLVGILSGLLGAGGGVMILLILVFVMGYEMHEAIGTSTFIMAFTAASGAIGHALTGNLPITAAVVGAAGTIVGGRLSARYANRVDEAMLGKAVGVVFALLGVAMLLTR